MLYALLMVVSVQSLHAQSVEKLKLKRYYRTDHLDLIIDAIGKDTDLRFIYDTEHLHRYRLSVDPLSYDSKLKTVGAVLKLLRNSWDMEVLVGEDGYIYIARDKEHLLQLQESNQAANVQRQTIEHRQIVGSGPVKKDFTLTGEIADKSTAERIPYAMISINGTSTGAMTDANGRFTLTKVPADTCTLKIDYIGYLSKEVTLSPSEDNPALYIEIEPQPQDIAAVFIVGRKADKALQAHTQEHKMKMAPEALKLLPNLGEKDILRGFQLMPGVNASNESSSGMYVRGGTPDQNLILYDGFTIYYVDHMHGFYSAFNSNAIKDVQLYKGGYEAKYGGRLSSVTEITAKDGNRNRFSIGAEVSLLSMNAFLEVPIGKKVTTMLAFRRSYQGYLWEHLSGQNTVSSDQIAVERPPQMGKQKKSPAYFYDLNAKVTYTPTKDDVISLSFFNGSDYNDNTPRFGFDGEGPGGPGGGFANMNISMDNSDYQRYGNLGTSLRWSRKLNERWSMNLLGSFSYFYATRDQSRSMSFTKDGDTQTTTTGTLETNDLYDGSLKNDWKFQISDNHTMEFGAYATYYDITYVYTQNGDEELLNKRNSAVTGGVYVQDKMRFLENRLVVTPGLRLNYFSGDGKAYFEPRLSASYNLTGSLTVNAATGLFCQFANRIVREDIMAGNTDFWILSDGEEIPVSRSQHYNLGLNYDLQDYIFSVEGYYKRNHDISEYTLRYQQNRIPGPGPGPGGDSNTNVSENFYIGDGYATGVELLAQKKAGKFSGWVSYAFGQVKNRFPEQSQKYYYAAHDVTHEVKLVGIYKFGNFDVSATWIYSSGRPYTAPIGGYQIPSASGTVESYYAVSDKNTYRFPDYHRLDLSASFRFNLFGSVGKPNAVSVSLFNAYNRRNVSAKQFQIVDGAILESNINYLSITPNVSLTLKF